jgi:SAM-dependent methyltransferase
LGLDRVQRDWDCYASTDPFWAILTDPNRKNGGWDEEAFFETGRQEIGELMEYLAGLRPVASRTARLTSALDFGCGVGRLSRALAGYYDEVVGLDISPTMVSLAQTHNAHLGRCTFLENSGPDLAAVRGRKFDLIYSSITLQHMPPRYSRQYVRNLLKLLAPGGLFVFQLAGESTLSAGNRLLRTLYNEVYRRRVLKDEPPWMDVYGIPKQRVIALLERSGARLLDVQPNDAAGPEWTSYRYVVSR